jgi:hypothetical protein
MTTSLTSARRRAAAALALAALVLGGLVLNPGAANATLDESNTFTGWTSGITGAPDFRFVADGAVTHDGSNALRVEYESAPLASGQYAHIYQDVPVVAGTTYRFSAWVRGEGVTASATGAMYFVVTADHTVRQELPTGTYDWQKLEWSYTIPNGQSTFRMRLLARGPGTAWIDDVTMAQDGTAANLLKNSSFEQFTAPVNTLVFTDSALVYPEGDAAVGLRSTGDEIDWLVRTQSGQQVGAGTVVVTGGVSEVDLSGLAPGYYSLVVTGGDPQPLTKTGTLAILEPQNTLSSPDHAVGMAVHVNRSTVAQIDSLMAPLGAASTREGVSWALVETTPGEYQIPALFDAQINASIARGERPLVILLYSNPLYDDGKTPSSPEGIAAFAAYAGAVAEHFGDAVDYEVYNEFNHTFNNGLCGTTPACYLELLEPTAAAVHAAAPGARVVGPALAGLDLAWLEGLFQLGGLDSLDVVSFHAYDLASGPEGATEAAIDELAALVAEYGDPNTPIWMTEHGWATQAGGTTELNQAAYTVRSAVLLEAAGVERIFYYDLMNDGLDPANREHNFGLARSPLGDVSALAAKPSYVELAVFNRLTTGLDLVGVQTLAGGVRVGTYSGTGGEVRVLWSTGTASVDVALDGAVDVVDAVGGSWAAGAAGQDLQLTVDGQPVYLVGPVAGITASPAAFATLTLPTQIAEGAEVPASVVLDGAVEAPAGSLTVSAMAGESTSATVTAGQSTTAGLPLTPFTELGIRPLRVAVSSSNGLLALIGTTVQVVENPTLVMQATLDDDGAAVAQLVVDNLAGAPSASVAEIAWTLGSDSGTAADATVPGGSRTAIELTGGGLDLWHPMDYSVDLTVNGEARAISGRTAFAPVAALGDEPEVASWRDDGRYVALAGGTPDAADLGGEFEVSWSDEALLLHSVVQDDDHVPGASPGNLWAGDSLQIAVSRGLPGSSAARVELGAALLANGPVVYSFTAPAGVVASATVDIARDAAAATTEYTVALPWSVLGLDPEDGAFAFSALVNDNDGGVRQGFAEWGSGIGTVKDVSRFLPVMLRQPAPSTALSSVTVDGEPLAGFDPAVLEYEIDALAGGPLPVVAAVAADPAATVAVTSPTAAPGTATITVTAPSGATTVYTFAVRRVVGDDASIGAGATGVCDGTTAHLIVSITNTAPFSSDVRAVTTLGDQRQSAVAAGGEVVFDYEADGSTVAASKVSVSAYVPYAAPDRPASYVWFQIDAPAVDCTA